jgi:hypothetical protein
MSTKHPRRSISTNDPAGQTTLRTRALARLVSTKETKSHKKPGIRARENYTDAENYIGMRRGRVGVL